MNISGPKNNFFNHSLTSTPKKENKLELAWQGPYEVIESVGSCDYRIRVGQKTKLFHANLLRKYKERQEENGSHNVAVVVREEEVSGVLLQDQGDGLQPVHYASRKLRAAELNYTVVEKECLAVVWGVGKFEQYLFGSKFVVESDHQPLKYLNQARLSSNRLARWALQLQQYDFDIRVIPGRENVGADYLSRSGYESKL